MVDLSHPISPTAPLWPGDPSVEFAQWADRGQDGYFLRRFSMSEHGGTHLTAPASYYPDGNTVDQYTAEGLVLPSVVIDIREHCRTDPNYALTTGDVQDWESRHGGVPHGSLVLLLTGWSQYWTIPASYLGTDPDGELHFPGFRLEAASLLVNDRAVAGLGLDTAGLEPGVDGTLAVSRLVLSHPRIVLENLTNLHKLPPTGAVVVIGALKLEGGSGSPAAVTAFMP